MLDRIGPAIPVGVCGSGGSTTSISFCNRQVRPKTVTIRERNRNDKTTNPMPIATAIRRRIVAQPVAGADAPLQFVQILVLALIGSFGENGSRENSKNDR